MQQASIINTLSVPLGLSDEAALQPLNGGAVNHVYLLTDGEQQLVVKWTGADTFSGIDRFHQYVLQEQLAQRELAPQPIWLSDDESLWVEKYIPPGTTHNTNNVVLLGEVLAAIHAQPITARPLQLTKRWQHYIQSAQLSPSSPLVRQANVLNETLHLDYDDDNVLAFCHNDLSFGHVLSAQPPVVVDWEYAGMGNRFFDLAGCAAINNMNDTDCATLCEAYAEAAMLSVPEVSRQFAEQQAVVEVTYALWQAALDSQRERRCEATPE
ncbi:phosphotransferase family protein [Alteromonas sp. ASW11-19]|uniref:Phosphotransferase family protein n=1 Tax=Alteromonas salexigens TaxID=2982530 RepID=A0ABT2VQE4_9ALTE|nr:choline/ethanolamine kinase family protein [Alteromonas salexigens]MCU7555098.1 phosphotransferase family protein [Alteromonas salexigens]